MTLDPDHLQERAEPFSTEHDRHPCMQLDLQQNKKDVSSCHSLTDQVARLTRWEIEFAAKQEDILPSAAQQELSEMIQTIERQGGM